MLSLAVISKIDPRASLEHNSNNFAYISSFLLDQDEIINAVKRATSTSDADWEIKHSST